MLETSPKAEICILGGRVFDGRARTNATAVAIARGRVLAVGSDEHVRVFAGPDTRIVDARGGLIHPGFVDAHVHAVFAGVERLSLDLTAAASVEETLDLVREAAQNTDEDWITGGGWSHEILGEPTRHQLDAIVRERPVALSDAGHHTLWVNSKALDLAGIDRTTPDPHGGHIRRDASGEPTGYLNETAAELVGRLIPSAGAADMRAGLLEAQRHLWSLGVTGWHEAILGDYNGKADCTAAYLETIADGSLPSLVSGALWIPPGSTMPEVPGIVERFLGLRERNAKAGLPSSVAKMMVDGVPHGETAALLEPYCSHAGSGDLHIDAATLRELILRLDAHGFTMHLHVMGDRGVRESLDAIEAARRANGAGPVHQIAHLSMVDAEDAARFGPLDVTANMQALWACEDPAVVPMIGQERMLRGYPFRSIADGGADLAMGSDWPVSPADPWMAIHVAVNRTFPLPGGTPPPLAPEQALTLTEALGAYTAGSARLALGVPGRIRIGERADLAVATVDPFDRPVSEVCEVRTAVTIVDGCVVHEAEFAAVGDVRQ